MTTQAQMEATTKDRRARLDFCKNNFANYSDITLEQIIRFHIKKANAIDSALADGSAAKAWRRSGDVSESLALVEYKRDEALLVAEAAQELLREKAQ